MDLKKYFRKAEGVGYLATASRGGQVNVAVYSRPHVMEDGTLAFGMTERLTHANLNENPRAVYAFHEREGQFRGRRIYLEMTRQSENDDLLDEIRTRADQILGAGAGVSIKYVVYFRVTGHRALVGD